MSSPTVINGTSQCALSGTVAAIYRSRRCATSAAARFGLPRSVRWGGVCGERSGIVIVALGAKADNALAGGTYDRPRMGRLTIAADLRRLVRRPRRGTLSSGVACCAGCVPVGGDDRVGEVRRPRRHFLWFTLAAAAAFRYRAYALRVGRVERNS